MKLDPKLRRLGAAARARVLVDHRATHRAVAAGGAYVDVELGELRR